MTGHQVVSTGSVTATDHESVHVGFDVTPDQREEIVGVLVEEIDLQGVPKGKTIADAYLLDNGDVAVHVHDASVSEYGY